MHFTGITAAMFLGAGAFFGVDQLANLVNPPIGIEIHSLTFKDGPTPAIIQDRTVTARYQLSAIFDAKVFISSPSGLSGICSGSGGVPYTAGRAEVDIPFDVWVADEGCYDRLPINVNLVACAEWRWGDGESEKDCTFAFRKGKTE